MTISTNRWGGDIAASSDPSPESGPRPRARWSRSPNVLDRPTLRGVMVLPADGAAVVLTGTAARVWQALARPVAHDELTGRLGSVAPEDVSAALSQLHAMGAVRETR
jgi:hypothetical protein